MTTKFGFSNYDVIQHRDVQAIICGMDAWGCRLLIEGADENGIGNSSYVNYPWSAIAYGQFSVVG